MSVMAQEQAIGGRPQGRLPHMRVCVHCGTAYDFRRSLSGLKLTYCGILCERADLGFSIESLLSIQRKERA